MGHWFTKPPGVEPSSCTMPLAGEACLISIHSAHRAFVCGRVELQDVKSAWVMGML